MDAEKVKKLSIQIMIGSLIGAAVIAVIAVLAGSFNDTFGKAIGTLVLVMVHALTALSFLGHNKSQDNNFRFFENSFFAIVILSFFTSVFGVWGLLGGELVGKLYGTYGILLFACLHGQMLAETWGKQSNIDAIVSANYVLMSAVILLILPLIWLTADDFPGVYFRILAATGIIDATLTILAVILHRLYIQKHPKVESTIFLTSQLDAGGNPVPVKGEVAPAKRRIHPLVWLLGIFIVGQIVISVLFAALGAFYRR
jgi:hypothetical protein